MARPKTKVTIEGIEDVRNRLQDPALLKQPMIELLTDVTSLATKVAIDGVDGGLGVAARSMQGRVDGNMTARVFSMMSPARAKSIDQGRKPGQSLHDLLPGIIRWREVVGHPDAGIVIAKGIKARGVKGRFYKQAARDAVDSKLPGFVKALEAKLEGKWKRGS